MSRPLKPSVRNYFEQPSLSVNQFERLETLIEVNAPSPVRRHLLTRPLVGWSAAAAIAAVLALLVLFPPGLVEDIPMTERIALEVVTFPPPG